MMYYTMHFLENSVHFSAAASIYTLSLYYKRSVSLLSRANFGCIVVSSAHYGTIIDTKIRAVPGAPVYLLFFAAAVGFLL